MSTISYKNITVAIYDPKNNIIVRKLATVVEEADQRFKYAEIVIEADQVLLNLLEDEKNIAESINNEVLQILANPNSKIIGQMYH